MFVDLQNEEEDATNAYFSSSLGENKDEAALEKYFVPAASDTRERSRWKTLPKLRAASDMRCKLVVRNLKKCMQRQRKVTGIRVPTS